MRLHDGDGARPGRRILRGLRRQHRCISACARRLDLGGRPCSFETSTSALGAVKSGRMCGPHNVTTIVRTAAPVTCRRTRAKTSRRATMNKIALLNDAFRTTFSGGKIMMTSGVDELPDCVKAEALVQVAKFSEFTADNDPHDEHDFGSFNLVGRKFFWKIDYYDKDLRYGSEDPSDPERTMRVLTVMLASEY